MAQAFGKTWWGKEWLKALTEIDYANRIPRGSAYARKGAVRSIVVIGNTITAKVSGSRPTPYKVTLKVPLFSSSDINRLMDGLLQQPALISKLLNRELDPAVLSLCKRLNLQVFPRRWNDLKMSCSCPDWAVPCKHIAAVIYMMSREIDNDPFIAFTMHGVDLLEELKSRGVGIEQKESLEAPDISSLIHPRLSVENQVEETPVFQRVDFTSIPDLTEAIANLLPKNPPFYAKGDFQQRYLSAMGLLARKSQRIIRGTLRPDFSPSKAKGDIARGQDIHYFINSFGVMFASEKPWGQFKSSDHLSDDVFLDALLDLPTDLLSDYSPSIQATHQALFCALHLLAHGAVVPQMIRKSNDYAIRWLPAVMSAEVAQVVNSLESVLPPDLVMLIQKKGKKESVIAIEHQGEILLSYLLGRLIEALSPFYVDDSAVYRLFFLNKAYSFAGIGEQAIPGNILVWLSRFFITQRQFHPSLLISEDDGESFLLDIAIDIPSMPTPILLKDVLSDKSYSSQRFTIFKELSLLSSLIRGLEQYINRDGTSPISFTPGEFVPFLFSTIPAIRLLGVRVLLPRSLQELVRPKVSMRISRQPSDGKSYLRLDQMLRFDWQVALGDELVSEDEFKQLVRHAHGLIRFRQRYIYVSESDIERLKAAMSDERPLTATQMLQTALSERFGTAPVLLTDDVRQLIRQLTEQADIAVPLGIRATLRPYQERGYSWMYRNMRIGFGSIIADDMGLGKTLQVISLIQKMKDDGMLDGDKRILIAVPTGLVTNWQSEVSRFAPNLTVFTYHGPQRRLPDFSHPSDGRRSDILLTTYGVLRSDITQLKKLKWCLVVIDEAQNIKNADTAQSKAVRSLSADTHIAMSGTPVENRLSEFWSIMDFANKGYLGTTKSFKEDYANPIQRDGDSVVAERFRRITAPFLLRRLKTDKSIISDLPDKIEQNEWALLTERQAALYQETLDHAMQAIEGIEATDHQSLFKRQGLVLQMILSLKQICNHPALFLKNGHCESELSGKSEMLLSLLESIVASGQKVLIFTQFREMGEMLQQMIEERIGERPLFLHGGCTIKQRKEMVDLFQQSPRTNRIFLLSLKAAGTGLNLTAASHVIHYDLWWNPAVEAQATDRAYRIGQHQNVVVHRFITKDTFEERINQMIQDKRHLADMTVATGESWIGKLSNSELREIFER